MMIPIPLWVAEVAICFLAGIVLALAGASVYHIVAIACVMLALAISADLTLFSHFSMDFIVVGNALAALYMVLGGTTYEAKWGRR